MRLISVLYFLLLGYMVTSLLFWGHSLDKQSGMIYQNDVYFLNKTIDSAAQPEFYRMELSSIKERENTRKRQYLGEGATFLLIILIGAGVVYTSMQNKNRLVKQQTNFILSITHELKSPIAAIKLNLQTLTKRKLPDDMQAKLLERSITESNRLNDLCNNLILASQMENRHFKAENEQINFSQLLNESVKMYEIREKHKFVSAIEKDCFASGDRLLWSLAINNLIENATKYASPDTTITVSLQHQDDELVMCIEDEGEGISDEEKGKIFHKFYRVGNEDSRKTKGTGLGLFLTSKIIQQNKGAIIVRNNQPKGTVFEVVFPAA